MHIKFAVTPVAHVMKFYFLINVLVLCYTILGGPMSFEAIMGTRKSPEPGSFYDYKIKESRNLFQNDVGIPEPEILIHFGVDEYRASYWRGNRIVISEGLVKDFTSMDLSAILAHEFSHAEWLNESEHYKDDRNEWEVDLASTKYINKKFMLDALRKRSFQAKNFYIRYPVKSVLFPAIWIYNRYFIPYYILTNRIKMISPAAH